MKYRAKADELTIDLDEARYLAKQPVTWGDSLMNKRIAVAKAVIELVDAAKKENSSIAWGQNADI